MIARKVHLGRRFVFSAEELYTYLRELEGHGLLTINNERYLKAQLKADEEKA